MPGPTPQEVRAVVAAVVHDMLGGGGGDAAAAAEHAERAGRRTLSDIALGADHGGFHLKQRIAADLRDRGFAVHDCGTQNTEPVDYPDIAHAVARKVADGSCQAGILVDGAGIGSAITANKVPGVRAATCWDVSSAENSREHNHANVLALGAGLVGENLALQIVAAWLSTEWGGGRHARRAGMIDAVERRYALAQPAAQEKGLA